MLTSKAIFSFSHCLLIVMLCTPVASAQWTVSSCEELALDPVEPVSGQRLLEVYLDGNSDGIGGLGCWVHHHPNGRDYVVTPYSWGREPNPGKKGVIRDVFDAMTRARLKYIEYGSLDAHLYYVLNDVVGNPYSGGNTYHGETFWLIENACWMRSSVPNNRSFSQAQRKQVFAHEIGHCLVMENVPDLAEHYVLNRWFDESVAEMLSSEAFPQANREHMFSKRFNLDGQPFQQPYMGYVFWYHLKETRGESVVVDLMNELAQLGSRETRLRALRQGRYDRDYHHFLFDFFQEDIMDSGGGGFIPREAEVAIIDDAPVTLIPDDDPIPVGPIEPERLSVLELKIPADHDLTIYPLSDVRETIFLSLLSGEKKVRELKETVTFKGQCDGEKIVKVLISHLNESTVSFKLKYDLKEKSCCGAGTVMEENPTEDNLTGTFLFDYYIESDITYQQDGEIKKSELHYYVNSKDNSILFEKGWILDEFGQQQSEEFELEAVIWLANKQLVAYVNDRVFKKKRAITIDIDQVKGDVLMDREMSTAEFLRKAVAGQQGVTPDELPGGSPWQNRATGYAYKGVNPEPPNQTLKYSGYLSDETAAINSPLPSFGFLVGYIRDQRGDNRKLVYSRIVNQGGDVIEGHLKSIQKDCSSFDGAGYEKLSLGGFAGTDPGSGSDEQEARERASDEYDRQMEELKAELENCKTQDCATRIAKKMLDLQQQRRQDIYDRPKDPSQSGTAGSDKQSQMKVIQDKITAQTKRMLDQSKKCSDLRRENYNCQGCKDKELDRCEEEAERLGAEMEQLACELAKLQGFADMMEDCD